MAGVLLRQLSTNIGHEVPANQPLFAWAFRHAGWLIDRFLQKQTQQLTKLFVDMPMGASCVSVENH